VEIICGSCGGHCKVNAFGITVACPHCSDHLFISEEAATNAKGPLVISSARRAAPEQESDSLEEATILPGSPSTTPQAASNGDADTQTEFVLEEPKQIVTEFPELDFSKTKDTPEQPVDKTTDPSPSEKIPQEGQTVSATVQQSETTVEPAEHAQTETTATETTATETTATETTATESTATESTADQSTATESMATADAGNYAPPDLAAAIAAFSGTQGNSNADQKPTADEAQNRSAHELPVATPEADSDENSYETSNAEMATASSAEHTFDFSFAGKPVSAVPVQTDTEDKAASASILNDATDPAATETVSTETVSQSRTKPAESQQSAGKTISWNLFILVLSYASAVTLALIYLLMTNRAHQLESLPDVKLPGKAFRIIPEGAALPSGHALQIGESQQFGNVLVTVTQITREPLVLEHFSGDARKNITRESVIKLWLKLKNISQNQVFSPLDEHLLLSRATDPKTNLIRANNFVCQTTQKKKSGNLVYVFDLPESSGFHFAGMDAFPPLEPGEEMEFYIPTTEDNLDDLKGKLVWRVHIRKGLHERIAEDKNILVGVTTLFEVYFHSGQIKSAS